MSMSKFNKQPGWFETMDWSKVEVVFYPSINGQGTIHAVSHFALPLKNSEIMYNLGNEHFNASFSKATWKQVKCFLTIVQHKYGVKEAPIYRASYLSRLHEIPTTLNPILKIVDVITSEMWIQGVWKMFTPRDEMSNDLLRSWGDFQCNKLHAPTVEIDLEYCDVLYGDKSNTYCCRIQTVRDKIMTLREMMQWQIDRLNKPFQSALTYPKNILVSA